MAIMRWHFVDRAAFDAGTKIDTDMYFITGENTIYRGNELFTKAIEFYTGSVPTSPAPNRIYVDSATFEGKMWDGSAWSTVIKAVDETVTAEGANPVSGKAVVDYVTSRISEVTGSGAVLNGVEWDPENHILTFTKGDSSTINITLDGVGTTLSYNAETRALSMLDASGEQLGDAIILDLERFVKSGEYDATNKTIILYFDEDKTDSVSIPVGDLVDTYTVESSATLTLSMAANKITGAVNISAEAGNALEAKDDGLYVAPTDVSNKMDKVADAVDGDIAILDADGNVIDSGKTFDDIAPNSNVYVGASIDEAVAGHAPVKNDICIVKTQIGETDKYQYTAYVHNGTNWEAMDGNYSAQNVYFPADLQTTSAIGNIKLTNGQATISAAGKNVIDVWNSIFIKESNPSTSQPSVSFNSVTSGAYEVGTTVTPSYNAKLNAGSYTYGPPTGITASSWEVTDTEGHSKTTNTGTFDAIIVNDDTNYKITAKATYEDGTIPVTNTGNDYASGQIKAGSKSATSKAITGFRKGFYGSLATKAELTSDVIRGLSESTDKAPAKGDVWNVPVPVGAMRTVFAYPSTLGIGDVSSVLDKNGLMAESKTSFTKTQIDVAGASADVPTMTYIVYYIDRATANETENTFIVTL